MGLGSSRRSRDRSDGGRSKSSEGSALLDPSYSGPMEPIEEEKLEVNKEEELRLLKKTFKFMLNEKIIEIDEMQDEINRNTVVNLGEQAILRKQLELRNSVKKDLDAMVKEYESEKQRIMDHSFKGKHLNRPLTMQLQRYNTYAAERENTIVSRRTRLE